MKIPRFELLNRALSGSLFSLPVKMGNGQADLYGFLCFNLCGICWFKEAKSSEYLEGAFTFFCKGDALLTLGGIAKRRTNTLTIFF